MSIIIKLFNLLKFCCTDSKWNKQPKNCLIWFINVQIRLIKRMHKTGKIYIKEDIENFHYFMPFYKKSIYFSLIYNVKNFSIHTFKSFTATNFMRKKEKLIIKWGLLKYSFWEVLFLGEGLLENTLWIAFINIKPTVVGSFDCQNSTTVCHHYFR